MLEAISTEPIKEKLRNLAELMPKEHEVLYHFGEYLAERLGSHPTLLPQGFNITAELALYDLQTGVDGYTGKPIRSHLVGYSSQIFNFLRMRVPDIADAVCPEDFSREVREFQDTVDENIRIKK